MSHNCLLIIGNGFDLTLKLKSKFTDFLSTYNKNIGLFKTLLENDKDKYKTNGLQNGTHSKLEYINKALLQKLSGGYIGDEKKKFIRYYSESVNEHRITLNFWALYFSLKKKEDVKDWADVEDQIYKCVTYRNFDLLRIAKYLVKYLNLDRKNSSKLPLNRDLNLIQLRKYKTRTNMVNMLFYQDPESLDSEDINILISFMCFTFYNNKKYSKLMLKSVFSSFNINPLDIILDNIFKYLKQQLFKFEKDLNVYLRKCVKGYKHNKYNPCGYSYKQIGRKLVHYLVHNNKFSLINFNYTNPLNKSYTEKRNIHGVLTKPSEKYFKRTSPVIGISADGILFSNRAYSFTKDYRIMRLSCNNYHDILHNPVDDIIFFGQSLDNADYSYFYNIFDRYNIMNFKTKLIFYYIDRPNKNDDECAITQMNSIDRLFEAYAKHTKKVNNKSFDPKDLLHKLSFRGKLIISNIRDNIPKKSDLNNVIK